MDAPAGGSSPCSRAGQRGAGIKGRGLAVTTLNHEFTYSHLVPHPIVVPHTRHFFMTKAQVTEKSRYRDEALNEI